MPTAPAALSPADVEPLHVPDESTLAALLDLFDHDHDLSDHDRTPAHRGRDSDLDRTPAQHDAHEHDREQLPGPVRARVLRAPGRPSARRTWRVVRAWAADVRSRAAAWGTGPEGVHRAW